MTSCTMQRSAYFLLPNLSLMLIVDHKMEPSDLLLLLVFNSLIRSTVIVGYPERHSLNTFLQVKVILELMEVLGVRRDTIQVQYLVVSLVERALVRELGP